MNAVHLLIDGCNGQYCAQRFAENFDLTLWSGIDPEEIGILLIGPDHPDYWETWDDVMSNASFTHDGHTWTLTQDSDVWALCKEKMTNEECMQWFGELAPVPEGWFEYEVCGNCLIALANDDYTGMENDEEHATRLGLFRLEARYEMVVPDGGELGFSHQDCECCDAKAGDRFRVLCKAKSEVTL